MIESLSRMNSQILDKQRRDFHGALGKEGDAEVFCFYETLPSPTPRQVPFTPNVAEENANMC